MSSLALFNSSGSMPFLVLTAVFLFIGPALFTGIESSMILLQKIIHRKSKTSSAILPRKLILNPPTNFSHVLLNLILLLLRSSAESIINLIINLTKKLMRGINRELDKKLAREIAKINSRDAGYAENFIDNQ